MRENAQLSASNGINIQFDKIVEVENPDLPIEFTKYRIRYSLWVKNKNMNVKVVDTQSNILVDYSVESDSYCEKSFEVYLRNIKISAPQKRTVLSSFKQAKPKVGLAILEERKKPPANEFYNAPDFKFVRDKQKTKDEGHKIIRVLVEVLYQLRNLLVHGELVTNNDTKQVYQHAYLIMQMLLPKLT